MTKKTKTVKEFGTPFDEPQGVAPAGRKWTKCDECELPVPHRADEDCDICNASLEPVPPAPIVKKTRTKKAELTKEQKLVMLGTLNKFAFAEIEKIITKHGLELVVIEDRLVEGYIIEGEKVAKTDAPVRSVAEYVADDKNREEARSQAIKLYELIARTKDLEKFSGCTWYKKQIVQKTTLTNSQADQVLQMLNAFGFVEFTKGTYEFEFRFSEKEMKEKAVEEVGRSIALFMQNITAFRGFVQGSVVFTDEEKKSFDINLKKTINVALDA